MKGISPFIATILLIAITVGIGAILSVWVSGLTTSATGTTGGSVTNQTTCNTHIDIATVTSTSVAYGNPSTQTITSVQIILSAPGATPTIVTGAASLSSGAYTTTAITRGTNTSVQVKGLCLGTPVVGTCSAGQSCWQ